MNQTWENDKKNLVSGPILAILAQIFFREFYLY